MESAKRQAKSIGEAINEEKALAEALKLLKDIKDKNMSSLYDTFIGDEDNKANNAMLSVMSGVDLSKASKAKRKADLSSIDKK